MDNVKVTRMADGGGSPDGASRLSPWQVVWHRRWIVLVTTAACVLAALVLSQVMPKVYTRSCQIVVEPASAKALGDGISMEAYLNTQAELIAKSAAIHADAITQLESDGFITLRTFTNPAEKIATLRANLSANVARNTDVITVSFSAHQSDEAALIVNAVVDAYTTFTSAEKNGNNGKGSETYQAIASDREKKEGEVKEQQARLAQLKGEIGKLQAQEAAGAYLLADLKRLGEAASAARLESINAQAEFEDFAKTNVDPKKLDALLKTGEINGMAVAPAQDGDAARAALYAAKQRLTELNERYLPNHPLFQATQARVDDLTAAYALFLHRRWVGAVDKVKLFEAETERARQRAEDLAEHVTQPLAAKNAEYAATEKNVARTEKLTDLLSSRVQEMSTAEHMGAVRLTVLDRPDPRIAVAPTRPNVPLMLLEGLIVGLILGVTVTFVDPRVRSVEEVIVATNLPVLGVIPHMSKNLSLQSRGRKVHLDPMSDVAEAYRAIRSAVLFGPKGKTILVTSPQHGEGKTTLAANLAIAMAEAGQRVLLVDGDLRDPMLHRVFAVGNDSGVSSIVAGRGFIDRAIQPSGIRGLDLLPCGPAPFNPSETINNQTFADLLVDMSQRYDYVLVDSPPVTQVTDARILAAMCDLTLLVVRAERSNRRATQDARDGLLGFGANLVGTVVNDGPRNRQRYGYYAGGYGRPTVQSATPRLPVGGADKPTSMNADLMFPVKR